MIVNLAGGALYVSPCGNNFCNASPFTPEFWQGNILSRIVLPQNLGKERVT